MGILSWMKKKEEKDEKALLVEKINMVDAWLLQKKQPYTLQLDATIPLEHGRKKEMSYQELGQKYAQYEEKIEKRLKEHGITGTVYDIYVIYQWIRVYATMVFRMTECAPSVHLGRYLMFEEAMAYYENVYLKAEDLCKELEQGLEWNRYQLGEGEPQPHKMYSLDGKELPMEEQNYILEDYQDMENSERLITMFCDFFDYCDYSLHLLADVYANAPYLLVDEQGNYRKIHNLEKTFANIMQYTSAGNYAAGPVSYKIFFSLIE